MSAFLEGKGRSVLILGATSSVARALAAEFAACGYELFLAARPGEDLDAVAADVALRKRARVHACPLDALDFDSHDAFWNGIVERVGESLAGVVLCFGYLGDQAKGQQDPDEARRIVDTNFTAAVSLLNRAANYLEPRKRGFVCALSSVAGDRGRQSNYLYGAAKAGLSAYLQGLRNRLFKAGVKVTTIKPGFMDTRMTFGKPGLFLVAAPEKAARQVFRALAAGKDVAYVPGFWWPIMSVIRCVPEFVFKRLKL
ncbi:MAG: SDR family oxidoreductase [Planctomycetota bacterium]|nr:SDR family oxidoreductase [Planctomycetota bacterium]